MSGDLTPPGPPSPKRRGGEFRQETLGDSAPRSQTDLPPSPLRRGGAGGGEVLPATLDLSTAAAEPWDVLVVGAGPAGALAAREAARGGARVLLVDRATFPRWKVCGCCLNLRALATLEATGLGDLIKPFGAPPLATFRLGARGRQAEVPLPGGVALSREAFDAALVGAAVAAGAAFLPNTVARLGRIDTGLRQVILKQGQRERYAAAGLVLAADGLGGRFLAGTPEGEVEIAAGSRLGAGVVLAEGDAAYGPGTIFMACGQGGYVGLVRLEDGRLDVAAAFDPEAVKRAGGLGQIATQILREAGFVVPSGLAEAPWRGTPLLTRRAARLSAERVLAVGDAVGYVEPFTGEGMAWALVSGALAGPLAAEACGRTWEEELADRWARLYHHHIGRRQRLCRVTAGVLRRPRLVGAAIRMLRHVPALAGPVTWALNRP